MVRARSIPILAAGVWLTAGVAAPTAAATRVDIKKIVWSGPVKALTSGSYDLRLTGNHPKRLQGELRRRGTKQRQSLRFSATGCKPTRKWSSYRWSQRGTTRFLPASGTRGRRVELRIPARAHKRCGLVGVVPFKDFTLGPLPTSASRPPIPGGPD